MLRQDGATPGIKLDLPGDLPACALQPESMETHASEEIQGARLAHRPGPARSSGKNSTEKINGGLTVLVNLPTVEGANLPP